VIRPSVVVLAFAIVAAPVTNAWSQTALATQRPELAAPPDVAAPPAGAAKSASGLTSNMITPGRRSEMPGPMDYVSVNYTGWTSDGRMFDSTYARGNPSMFPLGKSLPGWRECVQLMTIGEKRRCWIPQDLAYKGQAGRPTGTVVFDIELLDVYPNPNVPPPDVKGPPPDAKRTATGLAYSILRPGIGARRPGSGQRVTVHYTGWTTDGKMFDSSVARGTPATLGLDDVIRGWSEGLQMMVEGERTRFWIPQDLAYKGEAGSPRGMLVFDVELIRIER
jgi:peptidylprolyl isomerase